MIAAPTQAFAYDTDYSSVSIPMLGSEAQLADKTWYGFVVLLLCVSSSASIEDKIEEPWVLRYMGGALAGGRVSCDAEISSPQYLPLSVTLIVPGFGNLGNVMAGAKPACNLCRPPSWQGAGAP